MTKYIVVALILLSSCKKDDLADMTVPETTVTDTTVADMTPIDAKGRVLFLSRRISDIAHYKIFSMNADGTNQQAVSNKSVICSLPILSNSETKIAFTTIENDCYNLYVVDTDGQNQKLLAKGKHYLGQPAWSPDDSQLVFVKNDTERGNFCDIYRIQADGSNEIKLTNDNTNLTNVNNNWYPGFYENNSIVYQSSAGSWTGIYKMNADGSNKQLLTPRDRSFLNPVISRDGRKIVITSVDRRPDYNNPQLFVLEAKGNNFRQITFHEWRNFFKPNENGMINPVWSPDGQKIAYVSYEHGSSDIFTINADGTKKRRLTDSPLSDENPNWTADGNYILFSSDRSTSFKLYIMRAEGQLETALTHFNAEDLWPSFISNY